MSLISNFVNLIVKTEIVTILNGQTESNTINLKGATLKTIILPTGFNGTELTFKISADGVTFYDYYNINNQKVSITCTANRAYGVGAIDFYSIQYLKIISNLAVTAETNIQLITRGI